MNRILVPLVGALVLGSFAGSAGAQAQAQFQERAQAVGLVHESIKGLDRVGMLASMLDWIQTGAAMGDLNGDGTLDVIACGRFGGTRVFLNQGGVFTDATAAAGVNTSDLDNCVALGDYDGDGDLDLFLGVHDALEGAVPVHDRLYRNDGTAHFTEVTGAIDTGGGGHTICAKFIDTDYDGDLDLYLSQFNGTANQLHINNGDGTFTERAAALGADIGGSTHVTGIADVDGDGYVDILVGNDYKVTSAANMLSNSDDVFLRNTGDGHFVDVTAGSGLELNVGVKAATTMGMTFGDVNYDGALDVFRTEHGSQILALNNGWPNGSPWVQVQSDFGVETPFIFSQLVPTITGPTVGWGTKFLDADHDLWLDLFEVNGHVTGGEPRFQRNFMHYGQGPSKQFHFEDATQQVGLLDQIDDRGLCVGDADGDGDLDLIVLPAAGLLRYFQNSASTNGAGWLKVYAETHTMTDSLGYPHVRSIGADGSTGSHHEAVAHFGLGQEPAVDLAVTFPSGMTKNMLGVAPNQTLVVVEPEMIRLSSNKLVSELAGGTQGLTVTAFAFDPSGSRLSPSAQVTIDAAGLTPLGPVMHVTGNVFQREFAPAQVPGEHRVTVSFDGWTPRIRPTASFLGRVSESATSVRLTPDCVRAGSADRFFAEVTPRDANGLALGAGHKVYMHIPGAGGIAPTLLTDLRDGRYGADFIAPQQDGVLQPLFAVTGKFGYRSLDSGVKLDVGLSPSPSHTHYYEEVPDVNFASSPDLMKFKVTPRDSNGVRLGTAATATLSITPHAWSIPVVVRGDLSGALNTGEYIFVLERQPSLVPLSASGDFTLSLDGVPVFTQTFAF